jgi:hypothetical protein
MNKVTPANGIGFRLKALLFKSSEIARKILLNDTNIDTADLTVLKKALEIVKKAGNWHHNEALALVTKTLMDNGDFDNTVLLFSHWHAVTTHPQASPAIVRDVLKKAGYGVEKESEELFEAYVNHPLNTEENIGHAIIQRAIISDTFALEAMKHPKTTKDTAAAIIRHYSWDIGQIPIKKTSTGISATIYIRYDRNIDGGDDTCPESIELDHAWIPDIKRIMELLSQRPKSEWGDIVKTLEPGIRDALKDSGQLP